MNKHASSGTSTTADLFREAEKKDRDLCLILEKLAKDHILPFMKIVKTIVFAPHPCDNLKDEHLVWTFDTNDEKLEDGSPLDPNVPLLLYVNPNISLFSDRIVEFTSPQDQHDIIISFLVNHPDCVMMSAFMVPFVLEVSSSGSSSSISTRPSYGPTSISNLYELLKNGHRHFAIKVPSNFVQAPK